MSGSSSLVLSGPSNNLLAIREKIFSGPSLYTPPPAQSGEFLAYAKIRQFCIQILPLFAEIWQKKNRQKLAKNPGLVNCLFNADCSGL